MSTSGGSEGDAWLSWSHEVQLGYVWGFTAGISKGIPEGCGAYYKLAPHQPPHTFSEDWLTMCIESGRLGFSKGSPYYQKAVTEFYSKFPEDRRVPFAKVIRKLSDSEHMTPDQMHEWFKKY